MSHRPPAPAEQGLSRKQIADVLGVEERSITNYQGEDPPIPVVKRGRSATYPLGPCVKWFVEFRVGQVRAKKSVSELDMAKTRQAIVMARTKELELAQLEGQLVPMELFTEFCVKLAERVAGTATGALSGFVSDVQRAETAVQAQRLLERIGDDIVAACANLTAGLDDETELAPTALLDGDRAAAEGEDGG